MNTIIEFTIKDFIMSMFWVSLITFVFYLVFLLAKMRRILKKVELIVEENRQNIKLTMDEVPQITKNVQEVSTEIAHASQVFRGSVDNLAEASESVTETIKDNNSINEILGSFYSTASHVKNIVDRMNKKKD